MSDYTKLGFKVIEGSVSRIGLKPGSLKGEQSAAIRFLILRELIPAIRELDMHASAELLEILGLPFFGNDSQLRSMIAKQIFGIFLPKGKVKPNPEDLLSDLGIF